MPSLDIERQALRAALLAQRRQLDVQTHEIFSERIRLQLSQTFPELVRMHVGFYWPIHNEPDLLPLMRQWSARGEAAFCALLPVVTGRDAPLRFRRWRPQSVMGTDRHGIPYPVHGNFEIPQALLIPFVGCDRAGYRLGYGGGYYDRTLAGLPDEVFSIGVGYDFALIDSIGPQAHDQPLDAWVTESVAICHK